MLQLLFPAHTNSSSAPKPLHTTELTFTSLMMASDEAANSYNASLVPIPCASTDMGIGTLNTQTRSSR